MAGVKIRAGMTFQRHEKKYLVPPNRLSSLLDALDAYMRPDEYGLHTISSLYYDTADFTLIRKSLDKPAFKQKLRLRSYGVPGETDTVYLELKKKLSGVTYKRRMAMPLWRARDYMDHAAIPPESRANRQTFGEIDWFVKREPLAPKTLLSYDRIALYGKNDRDFRMTLDANIRWRDHNLDLGMGDYGRSLCGPGMRLLEIKTMGALPLWLCDILSELELYPQSFSKYGTVYTEHLMNMSKEVATIAG
ncbi:MAG: polyphosphate polymerase domain-containing protein [Oscillospiraceae bacterium]|jgi:hypothetical protein|nr:polyphosphate polymerase domain-containing protein [Oscillospiraceae bacterium]